MTLWFWKFWQRFPDWLVVGGGFLEWQYFMVSFYNAHYTIQAWECIDWLARSHVWILDLYFHHSFEYIIESKLLARVLLLVIIFLWLHWADVSRVQRNDWMFIFCAEVYFFRFVFFFQCAWMRTPNFLVLWNPWHKCDHCFLWFEGWSV